MIDLSEVEILLKNPPAHDPQLYGVAERAVSEFKKQVRATSTNTNPATDNTHRPGNGHKEDEDQGKGTC